MELLGRPGARPVTGALLGAIDVTGGDHVASPHVLTLVRATVAAVESNCAGSTASRPSGARRPSRRRAHCPALEVLGRERARLSLPSGPLDLSLRHSELLLLLAEAAVGGEGRTAARLATECHAADAAAVTVRAELSRLRRVVGATSSAPGPTACSAGSTPTSTRSADCWPAARSARRSSAIRAPSSRLDAPGVVAARERVSALLRQAVLRSRRPDLLLRYAQLPEARDDVVVWQTCLEWLPPELPAGPPPPRTCCGCDASPRLR